MTRQKPKPLLNYYIISKNQSLQDYISENLVDCIFGEIDSQFESVAYTDYTRHNALT